MANGDAGFKYDVAFSFLAPDLHIAEQLGDGLAPLRSFIWKRRQEDLAGTNGMETFAEVFKEQSRLNVVLLRGHWGQTDWTRVEAMAIQARALKGWESLFIVKLDSATPPSWIPTQLIYLDYETFGLTETVGAIRARAVEIGAPSRREAPEQLAERLARHAAQAKENQRRWSSEEGVRIAGTEVGRLFEAMKSAAERISTGNVRLECAYSSEALGMRCNGKSMSVAWRCPFANSLDTARLFVVLYPGRVSLPGEPAGYLIDRITQEERRIPPVFSAFGDLHWNDDRLPGTVSTPALGDHLLQTFLAFAFDASRSA